MTDKTYAERRLKELLDPQQPYKTFPVDTDGEVAQYLRTVIEENEKLRDQIQQLTLALKAAWNVIQPITVSMWKTLEPIVNELAALDAAAASAEPEQPRHGDISTCAICHGVIEFYESTATNGDVLDSWWSHHDHPADGHDAQPSNEPLHSTCSALVGRGAEGTAPCGFEIVLCTERTTLMADGTDGHGRPGGQLVKTWRHVDYMLDHMHTAQTGGSK